MKKTLFIIISISLLLSCNKLSKKEKLAQEDIIKSIELIKPSLPKKIDEITIFEKVDYEPNNRIVRYLIKTDLANYSKEELKKFILRMKKLIINNAKNNEENKDAFKILRVKVVFIYQDFNNKDLSFKIVLNPEDYLDL